MSFFYSWTVYVPTYLFHNMSYYLVTTIIQDPYTTLFQHVSYYLVRHSYLYVYDYFTLWLMYAENSTLST